MLDDILKIGHENNKNYSTIFDLRICESPAFPPFSDFLWHMLSKALQPVLPHQEGPAGRIKN